jgi:hypothetical protein
MRRPRVLGPHFFLPAFSLSIPPSQEQIIVVVGAGCVHTFSAGLSAYALPGRCALATVLLCARAVWQSTHCLERVHYKK